ncbi:unnamed protein product, partial [Prorocentrum cordatum]
MYDSFLGQAKTIENILRDDSVQQPDELVVLGHLENLLKSDPVKQFRSWATTDAPPSFEPLPVGSPGPAGAEPVSEKGRKEAEFWQAAAKSNFTFAARGVAGNPAAGRWQRAYEANADLKAKYHAACEGLKGKQLWDKQKEFKSSWLQSEHERYLKKQVKTSTQKKSWAKKGKYMMYDGWSESLKGLFVEEEYNEEFDETWTLHEECLGKDPSGIQQQAASDMAGNSKKKSKADSNFKGVIIKHGLAMVQAHTILGNIEAGQKEWIFMKEEPMRYANLQKALQLLNAEVQKTDGLNRLLTTKLPEVKKSMDETKFHGILLACIGPAQSVDNLAKESSILNKEVAARQEAGRTLCRYRQLMRDSPHIPSDDVYEELKVCMSVHMRCCELVGINADYSVYRELFREVLEHVPTIKRELAFAELFAGAAGCRIWFSALFAAMQHVDRSELLIYADTRGVRFLIEQPINSLMYANENISTAISMTGAVRFTSCMGSFGGATLKRLESYSTVPEENRQLLSKGPSEFRAQNPNPIVESDALTIVTPRSGSNAEGGWKAGGWVTGAKKRLKTSEHYPDRFCLALAETAAADGAMHLSDVESVQWISEGVDSELVRELMRGKLGVLRRGCGEDAFVAEFQARSAEVLTSGRPLSESKFCRALEAAFAELVAPPADAEGGAGGACEGGPRRPPLAVVAPSGTAALSIALRAVGVKGKAVVTPSNTFFATQVAVENAGGHIVFAECEAEYMQLCPRALRALLAARPAGSVAAVVLVHIGGIIAPFASELRDIAHEHGAALVEDAAHAHTSRLEGVGWAGSIGDIAAFSFFPTK